MNIFKDLLRVLALALVVRAVMTDSVACAISAGTLYMGGFDPTLHISRVIRRSRKKRRVAISMPDNVVKLRRV